MSSSSKKQKGGVSWQKSRGNKVTIDTGDWGVFVTCDLGREPKCIAEVLDIFSQSVESSGQGEEDDESDGDEDDIEAQIRKEVEGLKPGSGKPRLFQAIRLDTPCVTFIRFDKSINPEKLVHELCEEAYAHPEKKRSRYVKRMTPITSIRKILSVDLEVFAREILKPYFHSGGPPKKYAIRPAIRSNSKFNRDNVIKTIADVVGKEHPVDLTNPDLVILVDVIQNVVGMSVAGSDYDKLKRYNLAELYNPTPKPDEQKPAESKE
ncbi:THUMP domain protein [Aspergillus campestris IBT 28561]|uniref:THUMP domain protein n=1 Tax=Aspergillus campestris (strain IBT 28561) TaxID=1392248 RepID=A0A2I1DDY3_ASPC2|nr:THUMP domain protein [Aspergillus campestris IBT 28561]PKY08097.1 THUMP domain protein [Aspergillus campestris IBT 28561]